MLPEIVRFGPFSFGRVKAPVGQPHAWEARCPYHRNHDDHPRTSCKKRLVLPDEEETKARLLRWCLEGLNITAREEEDPRTQHLCMIAPQAYPLMSFDELRAALRERLTADDPPPALLGDGGDEGGGGGLGAVAARGRGAARARGRGMPAGDAAPAPGPARGRCRGLRGRGR